MLLDPLPADDPDGFAALLARVERDRGLRARSYTERWPRRRVGGRMRATGAHGCGEYARRLTRDPRGYERLPDALAVDLTRIVRGRDAAVGVDGAPKDAVLKRFHAALAPGGVVLVGQVETLLGRVRELLASLDARPRVFCRP